MKHIKEVDEKEHTVIAVQVENEPELQGAAREHSDYADELFGKEVPSAFVAYMRENTVTMREDVKTAVEQGKESGTWEEVFGEAAEEIFHTYSVAGYIDRVAEAGKKEYDLPMTVNAWLDKGQRTAGSHQRTAGTGYDDFWSVWHMTRRLNGDEVASMRYEKSTLLKIKLFSYQ